MKNIIIIELELHSDVCNYLYKVSTYISDVSKYM